MMSKWLPMGYQNCDTGQILILVVCQGEGILVCPSCCLGPNYSKLYDSMTILARCEGSCMVSRPGCY